MAKKHFYLCLFCVVCPNAVMFNVAQVRDEINVPLEMQSKPELLGVSQFSKRLSLSSS